ncbi:MAG TPA: hypothetical protein VJ417_05650, partial [Candidatus Glassbacteria bacterium]|nr:hypothetical protein [Candidatus Glassbacteria bacterium]
MGIFSFCAILSCRGGDEENPADVLARVAGEMAAGNDLREVRFDDLNGDGQREVILVYGPRELLNFDVYYCTEGGDWKITPLVNDKQNPREFVSTRLDSIGDEDGDGRMEIQVSSRLYDGNTMVKEIHWGAVGYEVVSQRTVIARSAQAQPARPAATAAPQPKAAGGGTTQPALTAAAASAGDKKPETVAQPKPEPIPPITPSWGTYMVRKG